MYPLLVEIQLTVDVVEESDGWVARGKLRIGESVIGLTSQATTAAAALSGLGNAAAAVLEDPPSRRDGGDR
jgi:hypothetical protein